MLKGLAKARHPAAKAAAKATGQAPAKQEASKKRSCSSHKQACAFTQENSSKNTKGASNTSLFCYDRLAEIFGDDIPEGLAAELGFTPARAAKPKASPRHIPAMRIRGGGPSGTEEEKQHKYNWPDDASAGESKQYGKDAIVQRIRGGGNKE